LLFELKRTRRQRKKEKDEDREKNQLFSEEKELKHHPKASMQL
jgi:hypothetical protein